MTPVVKKLEWASVDCEHSRPDMAGMWFTAWGINGQYEAHQFNTDPDVFLLTGPDFLTMQRHTTLELAQAAAQADYSARIIAALDPAWLAALEAQVKAADGLVDAGNAGRDELKPYARMADGCSDRAINQWDAALDAHRAAKEASHE